MSAQQDPERKSSGDSAYPLPLAPESPPAQPALHIPTSAEASASGSKTASPSAVSETLPSPGADPADKLDQHQAESAESPNETLAEHDGGRGPSKEDQEGREKPSEAALAVEAELSRRPDLKVHWKTRLREHHFLDMHEREGAGERDEHKARTAASRLVRKHTGRAPPPASDTSDTDSASDSDANMPSSSAVSMRSSDSLPVRGPRRRRQSSRQSSRRSSMTSDWSSDDPSESEGEKRRHKPAGTGGVLSALLGLYRRDDEQSRGEKGVMRELLSGRDRRRDGERDHDRDRTRRRWSSGSLFAPMSRSSSFNSRRGSRGSRSSRSSRSRSRPGSDDEASETAWREKQEHDANRVHRNRRHQQLPHRSQDLNDPYIPSPHYSNQLTPAPNVTIAQRFRRFLSYHGGSATWFGYPKSAEAENGGAGAGEGGEEGGRENGRGSTRWADRGSGNQRAMAALVITTTGLTAFASPTLAHVAPAYGMDAETTDGQRKVSWYEGVGEGQARQEDQDRREDEATGVQHDSVLEDHLEEGRRNGRSKHKRRRGKRVQRELAVTKNVSNIIQRKNYGAPAHSVEDWLSATADILSVEASFIFFPSILIVAFRDSDVHSTDVLFIRPSGGLELYRLSLVHEVYRKVVHDQISASQGCRVLRRIEKRTVPYSRLHLIIAATVASATAARVAFAGSFIDILMSGALGSTLAIVQFTIAEKNRLVSNMFEIGMAGFISFASRGLGSSKYFCYQSLASAAIVLILPGWHVCMGALELGSKNIVAGAIRLVWAVVYTLFLSLGLGIGSEIWDAFGPAQPQETSSSVPSMATIEGSFVSNNTYWDQTFNNASDWWLFLLVPLFAFSLAVWFRADYKSMDMLIMVLVGCAGYVVNFFLQDQIDQTNVVSAVSAFAVGILGNLYSRLGGGSAFPSMVVGILLLVPNAIAAAGGLSASSGTSDDASNAGGSSSSTEINAAVVVSIRMVQVGIGLAIGLFAAALVVYPFGKKRRYIFSY
ncbi:hypothetical protein IAU60_005413 [Kwoniella sp. DSM 27419]